MAQYIAMRRSLPDDVVLFFRLGDFYEMFFEDAKRAASVLNVALTKRHDVPMCGVPHHAAQGYIAKLVKAGIRVAIGEQTSTPIPGKLVEREIAQIISALACADHTTGEFTLAEFTDKAQLEDEINRLAPSEIIIPDDQIEKIGTLANCLPYDAYSFIPDQALITLKDHFKVQSLDGYGCAEMHTATSAAGAILHYLIHQLRRSCDHLRTLSVRNAADHVLIDTASQNNLDLVESRTGKKHTLLGSLDRTSTPMGARKLRDWIPVKL